jgi:hypothetical protein
MPEPDISEAAMKVPSMVMCAVAKFRTPDVV